MTRAVRTLLGLALAAGLLALVAPTPRVQLGTGYLPGWCSTSYDLDGWATINCTPGLITSTADVVSTSGLATSARIFVAVAIALVALAVRTERGRSGPPGRRSVLLLRGALAATVLGAAVGGLGGPARLAMVAAAVVLALGLRTWGALAGRRPGPVPPGASVTTGARLP